MNRLLQPAALLQLGISLTSRALILVLSASAPLHAQNLIHHWDFSSDGVVKDIAGGSARNGALLGGATVSGGVLNLNGSSAYVQFDAHIIPTGPSYTLSVVARAAAGANTGSDRDFISQGAAGGAFFVGVGANGSSLRAGDNWPIVAGGMFIADGAFHEYTITMSVEAASFYVDGELVATNAPFAAGSGGTATRLGRGTGNNGAFFSGAIGEIRIYDDALSPDQIRANVLMPLNNTRSGYKTVPLPRSTRLR
jgi:hypothetical protein